MQEVSGNKNWPKHRSLWLCIILVICGLCSAQASAEENPPLYGLYTAQSDGQNVRLILGDATRQMTHMRVSPDKTRITFTRYHELKNGVAEENGDYSNTEILIAGLDGRNVETIVPPVRGIINAVSSWTPDDKGLIYVSSAVGDGLTHIAKIDLTTRKITLLPTPAGLIVSDPHQCGNRLVFAVTANSLNTLWLMDMDGDHAHSITNPPYVDHSKATLTLGDYDPRFSPDCSKIAYMRMMPDGNFHIRVMDLASGKEQDLTTSASGVDGIPEWSPDGKLLIFWHADIATVAGLKETGVYTIFPDGRQRTMLPLPRGFLHGHPGFIPDTNGESTRRIVYNATFKPELP